MLFFSELLLSVLLTNPLPALCVGVGGRPGGPVFRFHAARCQPVRPLGVLHPAEFLRTGKLGCRRPDRCLRYAGFSAGCCCSGPSCWRAGFFLFTLARHPPKGGMTKCSNAVWWRKTANCTLPPSGSSFFVLPVISAIYGTYNYLQNLGILTDQWYSLWTQHTLFYALFFFPVLVGVYAAYLWRLEHMGHNWNLIMAAPVRPALPVSCQICHRPQTGAADPDAGLCTVFLLRQGIRAFARPAAVGDLPLSAARVGRAASASSRCS